MDERRVTPISIGNPFRPRPMTERVRLAMTIGCQQVDRLMRVLARLSVQGFAPIGFSWNAVEGIRVEVEEPADELVDGREVGGIYASYTETKMWFVDDGVTVFWYVTRSAA